MSRDPIMTNAAKAALELIRLGIAPVPVPLRAKGPSHKDWQYLRITEAEVPKYFGKPSNLGVILGEASGGLVDADLDCPEAIALASHFLPPTDAVFGRPGKPRSHYMYRSDLYGNGHGAKISTLDDKGREVCALRIGDGEGSDAQTIVPPSLHKETGELIAWDGLPKFSFVAGDELIVAHRHLSLAALLARIWPREPSNRNHITMAIAGAMAARGVLEDDAVKIVRAAANYAEDDEVKSRERTVADTYKKHAKGKATTGLPTLGKLLGNEQVAKRISDALGAKLKVFPDVNKDGSLRSTLPNTKKAIELLDIMCRFDLFKLQYSINGHNLDSYMTEAISDPTLLRLREMVYDNYGFDPNTETVHTAVQTLANHHRFHPVLDYLDSLVWDKQPRLDQWLVNYAGAEDTPYIKAVGSIVLIAAVRRVRQPGVKFDEWLVLEGEQGSSKSQALRILAVQPEWFTDQKVIGLSGRDSIEQFSGKWIIEAGELHGMRNSDIESIKAFMSRDTDRGRMAYARTVTESKRQCVIIGTTNSENYLRDLTGNRRFWPVVTGTFDLETLRRDRDQLWAEAAARETIGESIRLPEELWPAAAAEQQKRVIHNPFISILDEVLREPDEPIRDKVTDKITGTKIGEPMTGIITMEGLWTIVGVRPAQRSQAHVENLSAAMKELGWTRTRRRIDGKRLYSYQRGDDPRHISVYPETDGIPPKARYETLVETPVY
jgi:hypothetical protein